MLPERAAGCDLRIVPRAEMTRDDAHWEVEARKYTVAGPAWIAADFVGTLPADDQARLRELEARGEVRIATREEMSGRFRSDAADPHLAAAIAESDEIYELELALERAGIELPPPDPATISMPNFATSEVVPVRLSAATLAELRAAAEARGSTLESVIRASVLLWLRQHPTPDQYAEMADSYEDEPPRRDELIGEPFIAPSAMQDDDED